MLIIRSIERRTPKLLAALPIVATFVILGLAGGLTGCGTLEPVAPLKPVTDAEQLYMSLTLDHRAINLSTASPYDTLQLTVTPRNALGAAMSGLPAPTFRSSDTTSVWVTPDGLLQARRSATGVLVIAELVIDGPVRHADTALINVSNLASPPVLASLSIDAVPPDSGVWPTTTANIGHFLFGQAIVSGVGFAINNFRLTPRAVDADSNSISGLAIEYASLDLAIGVADKYDGLVTLLRPGHVRFVARTTAYGITKADTAVFTVTLPIASDVWTEQRLGGPTIFVPNEVRIASYGMVFWRSYLSDTADVTFDDPTNVIEPPAVICEFMDFLASYFGPGPACGAGNILLPNVAPPILVDESERTLQVRQFPVPGVYTYRSIRTGATGRVIVTAK